MLQELCKAVASSSAIAVRGSRTKNALLSESSDDSRTMIDATPLEGIVTYEPSEFLITAQTGTRISTLAATLAENGQYLPFDPVLTNAGATLGGTIASGISGPNRLLYGSLRDFVMEVQLIDGLGNLVRGGGKVVKNSAGFDTPKLMVGSYGRLGILTEATLKVFPKPPAFLTQRFKFESLAGTLAAMQKLQTNPLPISAIEIEPPSQLVVRYGGRAEALGIVATRAEQLLGQAAVPTAPADSESDYWDQLSEFAFVDQGQALIRVSMSGRKLLALDQALRALAGIASVRYSCGASVAWLATTAECQFTALDEQLSALSLAAVVVRHGARHSGAEGQLGAGQLGAGQLELLGDKSWVPFSVRIQQAMDPHHKFPTFAIRNS
ncbi:MAG: FAD-binding protein [Pirellulaceae bacterium]|nr:FAD-binding protein [Pirellulaceae bacterium]